MIKRQEVNGEIEKPPAYPAGRPPYFAMRFIRLMTKTVVASTLGEDVFALLSVIVTTEDARQYKSPVTFFNGQLAPLTGAKSWDALNRTRTKATKAKWLVHIPPGRGQQAPSIYWVTIPDGLDDFGDGPVDEGMPLDRLSYQRGYEDGRQSVLSDPSLIRENAEREHPHSTEITDQPQLETRINHELKHGSNAEHSYLSLNPIPDPSSKNGARSGKFVRPTIEEVTAYCLERGKGIDPQTWMDHYTANGWKVGSNPMRDWKAAVRTWERNGVAKPMATLFGRPPLNGTPGQVHQTTMKASNDVSKFL